MFTCTYFYSIDEALIESIYERELRLKIYKQTREAIKDPIGIALAKMKETERNNKIVLNELLMRNRIPINYEVNKMIRETTIKHRKQLLDTMDGKYPPMSKDANDDWLRASGTLYEGNSSLIGPQRKHPSPLKLTKGDDDSFTLKALICTQCSSEFPVRLLKLIPSGISDDALVRAQARYRQSKLKHIFPRYEKIRVTSRRSVQMKWFEEQMTNDKTAYLKGAKEVEKCFCTWECVKKYAMTYCNKHEKYNTSLLIDIAAGYPVEVTNS